MKSKMQSELFKNNLNQWIVKFYRDGKELGQINQPIEGLEQAKYMAKSWETRLLDY